MPRQIKQLKRWQVDEILQAVEEFRDPKIQYEQYPTPPGLAVECLSVAVDQGDIAEKVVMDLGCGTGRLAIGCLALGADAVIAVDRDTDATEVLLENLEEADLPPTMASRLHVVHCVVPDSCFATHPVCASGAGNEKVAGEASGAEGPAGVTSSSPSGGEQAPPGEGAREEEEEKGNTEDATEGSGRRAQTSGSSQCVRRSATQQPLLRPLDSSSIAVVDTVVTNPPFGTKQNEGIDIAFVEFALRHASTAVYSMHQSSTRPFLVKKAKMWGLVAEPIAQMAFPLGKTYGKHKKQSIDVKVDLVRWAATPLRR